MKKFVPYIFPALVLLLVIFLIVRWQSKKGQISDYGEGIQIENLSEEELKNALSGVGDYTTVPLEQPSISPEASEDQTTVQPTLTGVVRYEIVDGKVKLSVIAQSEDESSSYYVWLQPEGAEAPQQAFALSLNKGGLIGSGAFSADQLPVDVLVTRGSSLGENLSNVVLRGRVEQNLSE